MTNSKENIDNSRALLYDVVYKQFDGIGQNRTPGPLPYS